jgi:hypothetical protein
MKAIVEVAVHLEVDVDLSQDTLRRKSIEDLSSLVIARVTQKLIVAIDAEGVGMKVLRESCTGEAWNPPRLTATVVDLQLNPSKEIVRS